MSPFESTEREAGSGAAGGDRRRITAVAVAAATAVLLAGCGYASPRPSAPPAAGTVRVAAVRAADDNGLFEARPKAQLWTSDAGTVVEWGLSLETVTTIEVPIGTYTLSAFVVYMSDTLVCVDNTNGAPGQTCLQPTTGTGRTCDLPVVVTKAATVDATYRILANGRCRLDLGLPGNGPTSPASSAAPDASS